MYRHSRRCLRVVVHEVGVLWVGSSDDLLCFVSSLKGTYGFKKHDLEPRSEQDSEYLKSVLKRGAWGIAQECGKKRARYLWKNSGWKLAKGKDTPMTKGRAAASVTWDRARGPLRL